MLAPIRELTRRFAPEPEADMLPLIATELLANAYDASDADVDFVLERSDTEIRVQVSDGGPGFDQADMIGDAGVDSTRGRGLPIVENLADRFQVERADGWTTATAIIRIGPADA